MTLIDCLALHCHSTTVGGTLPDGEGSCRACVEHINYHPWWYWPTWLVIVAAIITILYVLVRPIIYYFSYR